MRIALSLCTVLLLVFATGCRSSKKTGSDAGGTNVQATPSSEATYPDLILSFFSPGNGIDGDKLQEVKTALTEKYPSVAVNEVRWGREGEIDLCLDMSALSSGKQKRCKADLASMVSASERVHVKHDEPCRESRQR